jgi:hypothetical protein
MKVSAVNQSDVHGRALELLRGIQPREASAQNHHLVFLRHDQRLSLRNPVVARDIRLLSLL